MTSSNWVVILCHCQNPRSVPGADLPFPECWHCLAVLYHSLHISWNSSSSHLTSLRYAFIMSSHLDIYRQKLLM